MLVGIAAPGLSADQLELSLLRAGHRIAWRAIDEDEVLAQVAEVCPEIILIADHPAVATTAVVGSCDLLGVRSCLVTDGSPLTSSARRLGLDDVLVLDADGTLDLTGLDGSARARGALEGSARGAVGALGRGQSDKPPAEGAASASGAAGVAGVAGVMPAGPVARETYDADQSFQPPVRTVIAVWGPTGAPGRTSLAIGLAATLAGRGIDVCLIDADTYGGTIAPALGLLDEAPGFAAACRLAGSDSLSVAELERVSQPVAGIDGLRVLTGIGRPHRWPELGSDRVTRVIDACRRWCSVVIIDAGFNLENDDEVSSELGAPRRNAATMAALRAADQVVAVAAADPLGLARFLRSYADLLEAATTDRVQVVANRVRASVLGIDPHGQVRQTLDRFAGIRDAVLIGDDQDAADAALLAGRPVALVAARSALAAGLDELADRLGFGAGQQRAASRWRGGRAATRGRTRTG